MVNSRLCETARSPVSKFETETLRPITNTAQRPEAETHVFQGTILYLKMTPGPPGMTGWCPV